MSCLKMASKVAALGLPLLFGASGCHEYKYVDVTVSFDQATFDNSDIGTISKCHVFVSGAETNDFYLENCPNLAPSNPDPHNVGTFEYSTFATSGTTLTFDLRVYTGMNQTEDCKLGEGQLMVKVTGETTIAPTKALVVPKTGKGCANNVTDGGT